jgi:hypothetical protein
METGAVGEMGDRRHFSGGWNVKSGGFCIKDVM